ncbi:DISARM system phospholipase D-like protein DrmC [Rosistilla oblonga]|uniref:DISARM system phospholipase D-like protein DrmC n=1 Tax=Rosistilla oblonga TaxID=2527990 RepID=UPI003A97DC29
MSDGFTKLSTRDLLALNAALRSGRITAPFSEIQLSRCVPNALIEAVRVGLVELHKLGFDEQQIAAALGLVYDDRKAVRTVEPPIDLVTSGPKAPGITNRDTAVVVRELFAHAKKSVLVVGYAVYQGQRVFQALAKRMEDRPDLDVQFFLNISRPDGDDTSSGILLARFKQRFIDKQWPAGCRIPEVFYDPRSIADDERVRSSLHAKCVVVDAHKVFVSSANFTEAGQERNIEVGLTIESEWLAQKVIQHFKHLHDQGLAKKAF